MIIAKLRRSCKGIERSGHSSLSFTEVRPSRYFSHRKCSLVGAVCVIGAFLMSYELGAKLLNYGVPLVFLLVNFAAAPRVWLDHGAAGVIPLLASLMACAVCALLWLDISALALEVGALWAMFGIVLGLLSWRRQLP